MRLIIIKTFLISFLLSPIFYAQFSNDLTDATIALSTKVLAPYGSCELSTRLNDLIDKFYPSPMMVIKRSGYVIRSEGDGSWVIEIDTVWGAPVLIETEKNPKIEFKNGEIGIIKGKIFVKVGTQLRIENKYYVFKKKKWQQVLSKEKTFSVDKTIKITVPKSSWIPKEFYEYLKLKEAKALLLVTVMIENNGNTPLNLSSENDIYISEITENSPKTYSVKGLLIDQSLLYIGLPEGVVLETESGWTTSVGLDPNKNYIGTHFFSPISKYKLILNPKSTISIEILFELQSDEGEWILFIKNNKIQPIPIVEYSKYWSKN